MAGISSWAERKRTGEGGGSNLGHADPGATYPMLDFRVNPHPPGASQHTWTEQQEKVFLFFFFFKKTLTR